MFVVNPILNWCMITKVTFQLHAPDEVALKVSSLDSFALFTGSLFKVISIDNKEKLRSVCSVQFVME